MARIIQKFLRNKQGVALIEFAIVVPFMLLMLLGTVEVVRYILIVQKVEKAAYAMTNIVSQFDAATTQGKSAEISAANLAKIMPDFDPMMTPYSDLSKEAVIFTSIVHRTAGNQNLIRWQMGGANYGGGSLSGVTSIVNGAGPDVAPTTRASTAPCALATFAGGTPDDADVKAQLQGALDNENIIVGEVFFKYESIITELTSLSGMGTGGFSIMNHVVTRRFFMHPRDGDLIDLPPGVPATADPTTDVCP